jgi:hypothetical protein
MSARATPLRRAVSMVTTVAIVAIAAIACGTSPVATGGGAADGGDAATVLNPDAVGLTSASKIDVLLVVDDSSAMGDKAMVFASSLEPFLRGLLATKDVHLGVLSTSLGAMGGDLCDSQSPAKNRQGHLSTRGPGGVAVAAATATGFLSFGASDSKTAEDAFVADTLSLLGGMGSEGCQLEAQLESMYRFLVQPDPWQSVEVNALQQAEYAGVDRDVLAQRKAFLRPDSLVVIVMLTDEDDSSADPRSTGGKGWAFMNGTFPGSTTFRADGKTTTAPRPTSTCATDPGSPDCASCACEASDPACARIKADPQCQLNGGYYGANEEEINVRFHRMKARFGVDPQFPLARYVDGLTKVKVPDRNGEHAVTPGAAGAPAAVSAYLGTPSCTNPLFASTLPGVEDDPCHLPLGTRGKELVVFTVIGGVPPGLVTGAPRWPSIIGANPAAYDDASQDPHMVPSIGPRAGLPPPTSTRGDNGPDPVHGREWDTLGRDLQYACTFALPTARNCLTGDTSAPCDCGSAAINPPLCGATQGEQIKAKAYPTIRELRLVEALGDRGVAGSICPSDSSGYSLTMQMLSDRVAPKLH